MRQAKKHHREAPRKQAKTPVMGIVVVIIIIAVAAMVFSGALRMPSITSRYYTEPTEAVFYEGEVFEFTVTGGMVSGMACSGEAVKLTLTNTGTTAWNIASDVSFYVNQVPDTTPGCDKATLSPGQSTVCSTLDSTSLGYNPTVTIRTPVDTDVKRIAC